VNVLRNATFQIPGGFDQVMIHRLRHHSLLSGLKISVRNADSRDVVMSPTAKRDTQRSETNERYLNFKYIHNAATSTF
jgi:hypothetical protein